MISHTDSVLATPDNARGGPAAPICDLPRTRGDHRSVLAMLRFPEGNGWPGRSPKARPTPGQRKGWCAGPTEAGNVFVMFFQTPIYE
ncbi:hypothetical protein FHS42_004621 [Streptomyces zagrosensis]|uniref:Uncharacterized protein n=1 Tax=Streptomyces zagrosensis TaxID=1042984 RepID=A0A7W9QC45_9ACTN|nr:hypothetical protein [Streptomyces zagrosensis]